MKRFFLLLLLVPSLAGATCFLETSTADTGFALGPFVDETDGDTVETALTITASEVLLKKQGSTTFAGKNESTACTHRSNGWYTCPLDTTDTGTAGNLIIMVNESGALPVWRECYVNTIQTDVTATLADTNELQTDDIPGTLGTPAADISADIAAVKVDTAATLVDTGTTLDALIDAIKAVTDQFVFTNANEVDANVKSMNDVEVLGSGTSADPWNGE